MNGIVFALLLAAIALVALFVVCLLLVGLTYGVNWMARVSSRKEMREALAVSDKEKVIVAAAVFGYLDAEQGEQT